MGPLAAFVIATPIFGLQLSAPLLQPDAWFAPQMAVEIDAALPLPALLPVEASERASEESDEDRRYAEAVRARADLGTIHRTMGIVTWASMTLTVVAGLIQYYNLYGFQAGRDDNPCATGGAVFGQDQCWGTPWIHAISATLTTTLYSATLAMSIGLLLNDPNSVLAGRGAYSDRIRAHAVLALVHLAGMVAQIILGAGVANNWFGDRTNDYGTLQTIATVHQVIGWTTWGALGAAGAIMLF
jgi:hypothetical protein